ncbi:MAG: phosphotransferase [Pirellulales bacterium]|nr:phosphotransferase [Pirellulales bacterium]
MTSHAWAESAIRWEVDPGWDDVVAELRDNPPKDWGELPGAAVVKSGPHRVVYRLDRPQGSLFVKHYRSADWRARVRSLFRPSAARREWHKSVEMLRRGVPTIRAVAWGESKQSGLATDNFFASEAIANAVALDAWLRDICPRLDPATRARQRRQIVDRLADLTARAHRAGVWHDDFHAGNILLADEGLYLIDVPGVELARGPLNWRRTRASLAMLCSGLLGDATPGERWRFWRRYLAARPELACRDVRAAGEEVLRAAHSHARRIFRGRDQRAWEANRDYYHARLTSGRAYAVRDLRPEELRRVFDDPAQFLGGQVTRPIKLSHTSVVVEANVELANRAAHVALKRCRPKAWWKNLLALVRGTRARVNWYRGQALVSRLIPTARPLAMIETGGIASTRTGYTLTEWIAGATNLHLYGWDLAVRPAHERRRRTRQLAQRLGLLVGRLHLWRISHRDLKGCNLLAAERDDRIDCYLIDLDGMRIRRWLTRATRMRDLARLAASCQAHPWLTRQDRLRFLRAYFRVQEDPAERREWKRWWREIEACSAGIAQRLTRRGEPVV